MPSGNVTVTVEPGSAWPVTCVSSLDTPLTTGASGAVVSVTFVAPLSDTLPVLSVAVAVISSPPSSFTPVGISIV